MATAHGTTSLASRTRSTRLPPSATTGTSSRPLQLSGLSSRGRTSSATLAASASSSTAGPGAAAAAAAAASAPAAAAIPPPTSASSSSPSSSSSSSSSTSTTIFLSPPALSSFLTNLRLLDLDLDPSWPCITTDTFSSSPRDASGGGGSGGLKKRIQVVEWALYHLFSFWDPDDTRTRLQPLFPPADQVQSLSLRTGLLRSLEAAKKGGVLGRDAVVRKTMLDECRGERLEEVLAALSTAVLRRCLAKEQHTHPPLAMALALENRGYRGDRTQLVGLILAHRASLSRLLRSKDKARARFRHFSDILDAKERSIAQRREEARALAAAASSPRHRLQARGGRGTSGVGNPSDEEQEQRKEKEAKATREIWQTVRNSWSGNERWMETLLHGDDGHGRKDGLLSTPFDRVWRRVQAGRVAELDQRHEGLLEQLERRATMHKERLQRWQGYRDRMLGGATAAGPTTSPSKPAKAQQGSKKQKGIDLGFAAHEGLQLVRASLGKVSRVAAAATTTTASTMTPPAKVASQYHDFLQNLQEELEAINRASGPALGGLARPMERARPADRRIEKPERISETSAPDNYVLSEHTHFPPPVPPEEWKQDGFSAAAFSKQEKPRPGRVIRKSTPPPPDPPAPPVTAIPRRASSETQQATTAPDEEMLGTTEPLVTTQIPVLSIRHPSPHRLRLSPPSSPEPAPSPTTLLADQILASVDAASPSPVKRSRHTLSLAERTRLSMAPRPGTRVLKNKGGGDAGARGADLQQAAGELVEGAEYEDENEYDVALTLRRPSVPATRPGGNGEEDKAGADDGLMARTRRSMAGFEAAQKKAQLERRRSERRSKKRQQQQQEPQASTIGPSTSNSNSNSNSHANNPSKTSSYFAAVDGVDEGNSTLLLAEELMSAGHDDYANVFMSRPKIKTSPIGTPLRGRTPVGGLKEGEGVGCVQK